MPHFYTTALMAISVATASSGAAATDLQTYCQNELAPLGEVTTDVELSGDPLVIPYTYADGTWGSRHNTVVMSFARSTYQLDLNSIMEQRPRMSEVDARSVLAEFISMLERAMEEFGTTPLAILRSNGVELVAPRAVLGEPFCERYQIMSFD